MLLAARRGERFRVIRGAHARVAEIRIDGVRAVVAFPLTYMNDSGRAAQALVKRYGIEDLEHLVVVHDELDLPVGRVKVKVGRGHCGPQRAEVAARTSTRHRVRARAHRDRKAAWSALGCRPRASQARFG